MNGRVAKAIRRLAEIKTIGRPAVAYVPETSRPIVL